MADIAEDLIYRELAADERLLWTGRPRQGFYLQAVDVFLLPFSLLWGGFAIFWEATVIAMGAPWYFPLFGIPFVLIGLYLIFGRFWLDARRRAQTIYAVTSQRVLILSGLWTVRTTSLNIERLSDVSLSERGDGTGTITFGAMPFGQAWLAGSSWPMWPQHMVPTFESIKDARRVYEIVRSAQKSASPL